MSGNSDGRTEEWRQRHFGQYNDEDRSPESSHSSMVSRSQTETGINERQNRALDLSRTSSILRPMQEVEDGRSQYTQRASNSTSMRDGNANGLDARSRQATPGELHRNTRRETSDRGMAQSVAQSVFSLRIEPSRMSYEGRRAHESRGRQTQWETRDNKLERYRDAGGGSQRNRPSSPSESIHQFGTIPGRAHACHAQSPFEPALYSTGYKGPGPSNYRPQAYQNESGSWQTRQAKVHPFPKDVKPADKLFKWKFWLQNFEAVLERNGTWNQRERAVDLSVAAGEEVQLIIMTERLLVPPEEVDADFRFYDFMRDKITAFFSRLTDNNTNARDFSTLKQKDGETAREYALRATLTAQKIELNNPSLLAATFINGMTDKISRGYARSFGLSLEGALEVATRRENNPDEPFPWDKSGNIEQPIAVAAIERRKTEGHGREARRDKETWGRNKHGGTREKQRSRSRSRRSPGKRWRQRSRERETRDEGKPCPKCGRNKHRGATCPADSAKCFSCQEFGHFLAMCKKKKTVRNVNASTSGEKVMKGRDREVYDE